MQSKHHTADVNGIAILESGEVLNAASVQESSVVLFKSRINKS